MYNCIACYRYWMQIVYIVNSVTILWGHPDYPHTRWSGFPLVYAWERARSSFGRAPPLDGGGRRFNPYPRPPGLTENRGRLDADSGRVAGGRTSTLILPQLFGTVVAVTSMQRDHARDVPTCRFPAVAGAGVRVDIASDARKHLASSEHRRANSGFSHIKSSREVEKRGCRYARRPRS